MTGAAFCATRGLAWWRPSRGRSRGELRRVGRRITVHHGRRVDELLELVLVTAEPAGGRPLGSTPSPQARL